jgi:hypothetical protein
MFEIEKKTKDDTCEVKTLSIIIVYLMISTIFLCCLFDLGEKEEEEK